MTALVLLCAAADGVEPTEELRAFAERETALLRDGDVDGATELNLRTWLQPDVDEARRRLFRQMQSNAFQMLLAAGDDVHEEDVEVDLARITCPVAVVSGARDLSWFSAGISLPNHVMAPNTATSPSETMIDIPA